MSPARTFSGALLWCALAMVDVQAAPSGAQLAATCARALAVGYRGVNAGMCDWYVAPCTVCGAPAAPPRWCVDPGIEPATLARQVVAGLAERSDSETRPAEELVAEILGAIHPCTPRE